MPILPIIVIGVGALLVFALSKSGKANASIAPSKTPEQKAAEQVKAAADNANAVADKTTADVLTGVGVATSVVGVLTPLAIKIATAASAGATTATGASVSTATATGATATGGVSSGATSGATVAGTTATVVTTAAVTAAEIAIAGVWAAIIVAVMALVVTAVMAQQSVFIHSTVKRYGVRRRLQWMAFDREEQAIVSMCNAGKIAVRLGLTYDGVTDSDGNNIERFNITFPNGQAQYFLTSFGADKEAQRLLVDIARWFALLRVQAHNEYMISFYFERNYARIKAEGELDTTAAIAETYNQMELDGLAMHEQSFIAWRDSEYFPLYRTRAWPSYVTQMVQTARGLVPMDVKVDTTFNDPDMYWGECESVARARLTDTAKLRAMMRVLGHSEALSYARFYVSNLYPKDAMQRVFERLGGYNKRFASNGTTQYVDPVCGWYFDGDMNLKNEAHQIIQPRAL